MAQPAGASDIRTFLIADVRGYTAFTAERGDEAAGRLASRFAQITTEAVAARGGVVTELRGDEALAVFGSARLAIRAAIEVQAAYAEETTADPSLPLRVGIGLDAGEAVAAAGGLRGAALNLAARLCAKAQAGEILASSGVIHLAGTLPGVILAELGRIELKGMTGPIPVVAIRGDDRLAEPLTAASPAELPPELDAGDAVLVGRDAELAWLRGNWRLARRGITRVVFLAGSPGMGKTRLAAELAREVAEAGYLVAYLAGRAEPERVQAALSSSMGVGPSLLVVDGLDESGPAALRAYQSSGVGDGGRLILATLGDTTRLPALDQLLERLDPGGEGRRTLGPIDRDAVATIAASYSDGGAGPPLAALVEASGGVPGRVHAIVADWDRRTAGERLGATARQAAADRTELRAVSARLTDDILAFQAAEARARRLADSEQADLRDRLTVCPFKGLASFEADDAEFYFGRERAVAELVGRLVGATFVGVVGPSGSGKSSLMRAGLLPGLESGVLPGSERWRQVLIRPSAHRADELAGLVDGYSDRSDSDRILIAVDQFEEVFTSIDDESNRSRFIDTLVRAAGDRDRRLVVALAIRADYYGRCAAYPALAELLGSNHLLVGPMSGEELQRAIELPAERVGLRVEPALVDALLADVSDQPGALPLLSTALLELWQRREGRMMRLAAYAETDGVRGAVARLAEDAYGRLRADEQETARAVLLRLADEGEAGVVRRRASLAEFEGDTLSSEVIEALADRRLLTLSEGSVEVAHEALLAEWPRLRDWLDEDAEGRRLRHALTVAAAEWDAGGRDPDELWRGARLAAAIDLLAGHERELGELGRTFIVESRAVSEREVDRQRRANRRLRFLLAASAAALVVAVGAGTFAVLQRADAERAAAEAERTARDASAREIAAASVEALAQDTELSLLLALDAVRRTRDADGTVTREAEEALHRALQVQRVTRVIDGGIAVTFGPFDDRVAVARAADDAVRFVDLESGAESSVLAQHAADIHSIEVSPAGSRLMTTSRDGRATTWDAATGEPIATFGAKDGPPMLDLSVAWDADLAAVRTGEGDVSLLDFGSGASWNLPHDTALGLHLSPDGQLLAVADGLVRIWDAPGRDLVATLGDQADDVRDVRLSPDGRLIAAAGVNGTTTIWDIAARAPILQLAGHAAPVSAVDFSPDGSLVATGSLDGTVRLWEVESGRTLLTLPDAAGPVTDVAFDATGTHVVATSADRAVVWPVGPVASSEVAAFESRGDAAAYAPDGQAILAGGFGGTARVFDAITGHLNEGPVEPLPAKRGTVLAVATDPTGSLLAAASDTGQGFLLRRTDLETVRTLDGHIGPVVAVAFDSSGARAVTGGQDGTIRLWDVAEPTSIFDPDTSILSGHVGPVHGVAFSPDGALIASAGEDGTVRLWSANNGDELGASSGEADGYRRIAFSPDGSRVAAATDDGRVLVWQIDGTSLLEPPLALRGHQALAFGVAFDPQGDRIATGSFDGTVRLWDVVTGRELLVVSRQRAGFGDVAFSPDGTHLAAAGVDGVVRVYGLDLDELVRIGADRVRRAFTDAECVRYLHLESCDELPASAPGARPVKEPSPGPSRGPDRDPAVIARAFVDAMNAGEVDVVIGLLAPDAEIVGHWRRGRVQGPGPVRLSVDEWVGARWPKDAMKLEAVTVRGGTADLTYRWRWRDGWCTQATGLQLVVHRSLITRIRYSPDEKDCRPQEILDLYVEAYNAGDLDSLASLFLPPDYGNSTIRNHPSDPEMNTPSEIRAFLADELASGGGVESYAVSNVTVEGRRIRFDDIQRGKDGSCRRGVGHTIDVPGGMIANFTFGEVGLPCE
jgi:WD40 repeat protein/class 3 adenylate cyclase